MGGMAIVGRYSSRKLSTASLVVDMSRSRAASSTVALSASSTTLDMSTFATPENGTVRNDRWTDTTKKSKTFVAHSKFE